MNQAHGSEEAAMKNWIAISLIYLIATIVIVIGAAQRSGLAADSATPRTNSPVATTGSPPFACHVTLPNGLDVPGSPASGMNAQANLSSGRESQRRSSTSDLYGNGHISAAISTDGIFAIPPDSINADGSLGTKVPWWWAGVKGYMFIEGHRLDAPAPPLQATGGMYGRFDAPTPTPLAGLRTDDTDRGFAPSGLIFPTEGCWQITGRVGGSTLTFVAIVDALPVQPVRPPSGTPASS
jgi:hypothetical protein